MPSPKALERVDDLITYRPLGLVLVPASAYERLEVLCYPLKRRAVSSLNAASNSVPWKAIPRQLARNGFPREHAKRIDIHSAARKTLEQLWSGVARASEDLRELEHASMA
eukprot:CAMPEP_0197534426 /NCGR_PEP_ID=MMETSP1318-20131121/47116_1 /TAXON_ID=552666 /ORGANISM="Partenskyella glossopodia, Strain RCC365" /LENGTH=109 /DNA_ID=CAMNT_0043091689 /DNA_START=118 /DNA_END=447 /DNA_ORIENTATION=+